MAMGTKNIVISDEAYLRLKSLKKPGESFTELIGRITRRNAIFELVGTLKPKEGQSMKRIIGEMRSESSDRLKRGGNKPRATRQH